jgi:hypothetical protein
MYLNHFDEAQAAANDAKTKSADSAYLHWLLYLLALVKGDAAGMAEAANWAVGKPGLEDLLLYYQAGTAAYFGSLQKSREFSNRAIALGEHAGQKKRRPVTQLMPPCAKHYLEIPLMQNALRVPRWNSRTDVTCSSELHWRLPWTASPLRRRS